MQLEVMGGLMPSSVTELLKNAGLSPSDPVSWGNRINDNGSGIYIISLSSLIKQPPIDLNAVKDWIDNVPTLTLDGHRPSPAALRKRLSEFWLPNEKILYIGKTKRSIRQRLNEFYRHCLGNRSPHAGGQWLKTLSNLDNLNVYWVATSEPEEIEKRLLNKFIENVSNKTRSNLRDGDLPLPFANLQLPVGRIRHHGIQRAGVGLGSGQTK